MLQEGQSSPGSRQQGATFLYKTVPYGLAHPPTATFLTEQHADKHLDPQRQPLQDFPFVAAAAPGRPTLARPKKKNLDKHCSIQMCGNKVVGKKIGKKSQQFFVLT